MEVVEEAWSSVPNSRCPFDALARKFIATVKSLQSWSHKKVGHINSQLRLAREVHQLEIALDTRSLSNQEMWLLLQLKKHSLALSSLQRTIPRSRPRISWHSEGDCNTALFHLHARHCKRKNFISNLVMDDGQVLTSHEEKENNILEFYLNLLGDAPERETTVNLEALTIPHHDLSGLEAPFSEEEFGKLFARYSLTKLLDLMGSQESFTRSVGLLSNLMSWQQCSYMEQKNRKYFYAKFCIHHPVTQERRCNEY